MSKVQCLGLQIDYPRLNLELLKSNPKGYHKGIFFCVLKQAQEGYYFSKISKATKRGTSIKYKSITSQEQSNEFENVLKKMANDLNEKYNAGIELRKLDEEN